MCQINENKSSAKSIHHSFDMDLAIKYGMEEAVIIHHFQHWIRINENLKRNLHNGRYWTYQTFDEIAAALPYLSRQRIIDLIDKLCIGKSRFSKKNGKDFEPVLMKGNFNKSRYDRTVWYAFCDHKAFVSDNPIPENDKKEFVEPQNESCGTTTPVPDSIPDSKTLCVKEKQEKEIERKENISTTDLEHNLLVKEHGLEMTNKLYTRLSLWKKDTPRNKWKKNDYRSILRWVLKVEKESTAWNNSKKPNYQTGSINSNPVSSANDLPARPLPPPGLIMETLNGSANGPKIKPECS